MRDYGKIKSSLHRSQRWRQIEKFVSELEGVEHPKALSRLAKITYVYLQSSGVGNAIGTFLVPPEMAAVEMQEPAEEVRISYRILAAVRLIEYDEEEEIVRIIGFLDKSPITNMNHQKACVRALDSLPARPMKIEATIDVLAAMMLRTKSWMQDIRERAPRAKTAKQQEAVERLQAWVAAFYEDALVLLRDQDVTQNVKELHKELSKELSEQLSKEDFNRDRNRDRNRDADRDADGDGDADGEGESERERLRRARTVPPDIKADIEKLIAKSAIERKST